MRAVKNAMVVGDMPFDSYQVHGRMALDNARQFIDAGCQAVKLEWFEDCPQVASAITGAGIAVMGHVGLTPQTAQKSGGMKVQRQGRCVGPSDHKKCPGFAGCGMF